MQAKQYVEYVRNPLAAMINSDKRMLIISEIGYDQIATATSFVEYIYEKYGVSRSTIWYNMNEMKKNGVLDFADKDNKNKPLALTRDGVTLLRSAHVKQSSMRPVAYA